MKTKLLIVLFSCFCINSISFAQESEKKEKVKIRIEKNINGTKQVIEKEIDASGMSNENRQIFIEESIDSLVDKKDLKRNIKVTVDANGNVSKEERFEIDEDVNFDTKNKPRVQTQRRIERDFEDLGYRMKSFGEEFPKRFEKLQLWDEHFLNEEDGSPIRSLKVFPNRPESEIVNVKFYAPKEGDVNIVITDIKGSIVAKSESKNFKGEYVGQLKLSKKATGTYFVMVSQGADGLCRRLVI